MAEADFVRVNCIGAAAKEKLGQVNYNVNTPGHTPEPKVVSVVLAVPQHYCAIVDSIDAELLTDHFLKYILKK